MPKAVTVDVRAGGVQTATIRLERLVDLPARGWYSGDSHVHDLHQGFGQTHESFFRQLVAEDLNVTHALIHMDGTRLMGRWARPHRQAAVRSPRARTSFSTRRSFAAGSATSA